MKFHTPETKTLSVLVILLLATFCITNTYSQNRIHHWRFNDNANNEVGGPSMNLEGSTYYYDSPKTHEGSHVLNLNGSDRYAWADGLNLPDIVTFVGLFYKGYTSSDSYTQHTFFSNTSHSNPDGFRAYLERPSGKIYFVTGDGSSSNDAVTIEGANPPSYYEFIQYAFVVDRTMGTCQIYVDGDLVTTDNTILPNFNISGPIRIGKATNDTYPLWGYADDFRIYNGALTQAQIQTIMNDPSGTHDFSGGTTQYTLTVTPNIAGAGTITLTPPGGVYDAGTEVVLSAIVNTGYEFTEWTGDVSGHSWIIDTYMNSNKNVTANFSVIGDNESPSVSNVAVTGNLEIGETLTGSYQFSDPENDGDASTYQWYRSSCYRFIDPEEIPGANGLTYQITSNDIMKYLRLDITPVDDRGAVGTTRYVEIGPMTDGAVFEYTLDFNIVGNGSIVELYPDRDLYAYGEYVDIFVSAENGYEFTGFEGGDIIEQVISMGVGTIEMTGSRTITVNFEDPYADNELWEKCTDNVKNIYHVSGHVGIGTTNPTHSLTVTGNAYFGNSLRSSYFIYNNNDGTILMDEDGYKPLEDNYTDGLKLRSRDTKSLGLYIGDSEKLHIQPDGNVGIGIDYPDEKLQVIGNGKFFGKIYAHYLETGAYGTLIQRADGDTYLENNFTGDGGLGLYSRHTNPIGFNIDDTEAMRIHSNGNVGVGITSPENKLHLYNNASMAGWTNINTANAGLRIQEPGANLFFDGNAIISDEFLMIGTLNSDALSFGTDNQEQMRITSDGKVGIGTLTPTEALTVNGNIKAEGFIKNDGSPLFIWNSTSGSTEIYYNGGNVGIGTSNPTEKLTVKGKILAEEVEINNVAADFVFDDDYVLPELEEVEEYISENNHLPGIPPASVTKEGVEIGGFTQDLLQKIEELTLYTIELNKQVKELNEENRKLLERMEKLENNSME